MTRDELIGLLAKAIGGECVNLNMDIAGIIEDGSPSADVPEILRDAAKSALASIEQAGLVIVPRAPAAASGVTASPVLRTEPASRLGPDGQVPTGAGGDDA